LFDGTLASVQSERIGLRTAQFKAAFNALAEPLKTDIGDPELLSVYSSTGLSSHSCISIRSHVLENRDILSALLQNEDTDITDLLHMALPTCLSLPEMQSSREVSADHTELVLSWLRGTDIRRIIEEFATSSGEASEIGRFIDELFSYLLPWGLSAYLSIGCKVLGITRTDLSQFSKFLPSMVKYGLPTPFACWAMAAGIPFRQTAIQIAGAFQRERDHWNYQEFLAWLSTLTTDRLRYEFGLRPPLIEDVTRAIVAISANPTLRSLQSISDLLPLEVELVGTEYEERHLVAEGARVGQQVMLARDYDNPIDRNAITVSIDNRVAGYLPRAVAQMIAPEMDTGTTLRAIVASLTRGDLPHLRITITVPSET
jgi:hypothetical protein